MKLVIGLGNPGNKYAGTRHNLGFAVLDEYAKKHQGKEVVWTEDKKFHAEILKLSPDLWLVRPQTYMNNSGEAVSALLAYFKVDISEIIIVHDELDLPLGKIKVREGGSGGGHHGVESIISALGSDKFVRVRLGIGNLRSLSSEHGGQSFNVEHYVLEPFTPGERPKVKQMIKKGIDALETLINEGLVAAQNQYN